VENAGGLGRYLAGRLAAASESVVDVPPKLSARVRVRSRSEEVDFFDISAWREMREVFNGLRWIVRTGSAWPDPTATILDSRTLRSTPKSGSRGGCDLGAKRKRGTKVHAAVDTLGQLLALFVTPANNEQERAWAGELAEAVQEATGESVELAYLDEGYTGERPAEEAEAHGMRLEVVKHEEANRGFVLLPHRWVVERDFAWASRFRRLVRDYERLPTVLVGLHFVAFAGLFLRQATSILGMSS
jgi:transposase